jgi:HAD superfamily hydrolase (TIGR01509 family)
MQNNLRLIIFDLSDVLIKGIEGVETTLAKELEKEISEVKEQLFSFDYRLFWIGQTNENDFLKSLIKTYQWDIKVEKLKQLIRSNFYEIPGTREIINELKKRYQIVLLSVNPPEWVTFLENKFDIVNLFPQRHYSYEIKSTKREKEAFEFILREYNIESSKTLLIDDSTRNILVAESLGIKGIKFKSAVQLKKELINLKII